MVQTYYREDDLLLFAHVRFLHLFFESGIQKKYNEYYLEKICLYLDDMCHLVFNNTLLSTEAPNGYPAVNQLLFFALPNDLAEILLHLRFQELIFSELEAYEICHNISLVQQETFA